MSVASRVTGADPKRQWFIVEDDTNSISRFRRERELGHDARAQAVWENPHDFPVLLLGSDGKALLRQDAPGLPEKIVVRVDDPLMPGTAGGIFTAGVSIAAIPVEFVRV